MQIREPRGSSACGSSARSCSQFRRCFYDPILNEADYVLGDGADTSVAFGAYFEILLAIANIPTAVVIYRIARRVHEAVAIGYGALRIMEARSS